MKVETKLIVEDVRIKNILRSEVRKVPLTETIKLDNNKYYVFRAAVSPSIFGKHIIIAKGNVIEGELYTVQIILSPRYKLDGIKGTITVSVLLDEYECSKEEYDKWVEDLKAEKKLLDSMLGVEKPSDKEVVEKLKDIKDLFGKM